MTKTANQRGSALSFTDKLPRSHRSANLPDLIRNSIYQPQPKLRPEKEPDTTPQQKLSRR